MAWTQPQVSRSQVKKAGKALVRDEASPAERQEALTIVNNWRAAHSYPLNALSVNARAWARQVGSDAAPAQRIKRLPSIEQKLRRLPHVSLASMQDIGGTRLVVATLDDVRAVEARAQDSRQRHRLVDHDDYINRPKPSGYRSVHLVHEYHSTGSGLPWDGLKVELQIRTALQHAWATAVETVGLFTRQALKSSQGNNDWLRFFALVSAEFAAKEGTPGVPGVPDDPDDRLKELSDLADSLDVLARLSSYQNALKLLEDSPSDAAFYLLVLDPSTSTLAISPFRDASIAAQNYSEVEAANSESGLDVVLVRTGSFALLRRAYPNYFADTSWFIEELTERLHQWKPVKATNRNRR